MKTVVVYNPKSGSALPLDELKAKLTHHGISVQNYVPAGTSLKSFATVDTRIMVVGGDGTLSAAAGAIIDTRAVLVPLPGGTRNHFTRDLGIPQDLDEALAALKNAKIHNIDIATVNDAAFINNSSIGLYPSSLRERERVEDRLGKWLALVLASFRTLVRLPGFSVTIDDETFRTPFVFVGNNDYGMATLGAPVRTQLDQGFLSIFIAKRVRRWSLVKIALWALVDKAHLLNDFEIRRATTVTIETAHRRPSVSRDGEVGHMDSPLCYRIKPKALRVLY